MCITGTVSQGWGIGYIHLLVYGINFLPLQSNISIMKER